MWICTYNSLCSRNMPYIRFISSAYIGGVDAEQKGWFLFE
jgi:hypothetical protein